MDDMDFLEGITSCNKVENVVMLSEYEQNLSKEKEDNSDLPGQTNTGTTLGGCVGKTIFNPKINGTTYWPLKHCLTKLLPHSGDQAVVTYQET